MSERKIKRALIAVYDKTGIVEFARALAGEFAIEIISTGGTAKHLKDAGIPVTLVEDVTGFPEMLDGRVKTLHPKIHAAILADRDNPEHMRQLAEQGIEPIDMVVVNLYPFEKTVADPNCTFEQAIEMIDIGGPCLLRAAAKNHKHVLVVNGDPAFYQVSLQLLRLWNERVHRDDALISGAFGAFWSTAGYDAQVAQWLITAQTHETWKVQTLRLWMMDRLRYGENPHQQASYHHIKGDRGMAKLLHDDDRPGQPISFNNFVDADAALRLCEELTRAETGRAKILFAPLGGSEAGCSRRFKPIKNETSSRRKLPHWQIPGAAYFVTFTSAIGDLSEAERDIVMTAVKFWDGKKLDLFAAVVMPDHVHMLLEPRPVPASPKERFNLSEIMQSIKANSGRDIAKGRGISGQVWTRESYDRWIRNEDEFIEKWQYIANNPIKENLADSPENYRWWIGRESLGPFDLSGIDEKKTESKENLCPTDEVHQSTSRGKEDPCPTVVFIKHTNACGVGVSGDPVEAYRCAYLGDPNAAMGGVLAVNFEVTTDFAELVMETYDRLGKAAGAGGFFVEVWLAPSFEEKAVEIIRTRKKWGENVRLLAVADMTNAPDPDCLLYRSIAGGMLVQTPDLIGLNEDQWKVATKRQPTESEMSDLRLAWLIAKHTKSNAISICKDGMLIGNGAGQMSRVMSCRIATWLAKENGHADKLAGSAAASDAFFPFRDGPDILIDAGVSAIIQPGGSKRDEDTIKACDERGVAMIFTGTRHFKH